VIESVMKKKDSMMVVVAQNSPEATTGIINHINGPSEKLLF
jgi:hypothetical protein